MAEYTENLHLIKPGKLENYNVDVANTNNDTIDAAIGGKQDKVPGKGPSTNDFTNGYKQQVDINTTNIVTLQSESGHTIELILDNSTYILTATLKNRAGSILNQSNVDFPVESMIINVTYDENTKELVITLQSGIVRRIPLSDIIDGLVSQSDFDELEYRVITAEEDISDIKIEQTEQNENITKLKAENETLNSIVNQLPQVSDEGYDATLNNTIKAPFTKFDVEGHSEQESTSIADGDEYDSPSPEHEQPIKSAGENVNLLPQPFSGNTKTVNGVTFTKNPDGTVIVNGTATANAETNINISAIFEDRGEQYTLSGCPQNGGNDKYRIAVVAGGVHSWSNFNDYGNGKTFVAEEGEDYILFISVYAGVTVNNLVFKPKIEKGSKATPYSPYGMGSITEKIVNRNLVKFNKINTIDIVDGSATYSSAGTIHFYFDQIKLKAGNYCFYINPQTKGTNSSNQNLANSDGSVVYGTFTFRPSGYSYCDFTLTQDTTLNDLRTYLPSGYAGTLSEISLIKGTHEDISTYINHEEQTYSIYTQQPFRSIGDVRDVFFKNTVDSPYYDSTLTLNGWYERHDIKRLIFDGTENWQFDSSHYRFFILLSESQLSTNRSGKSNYFKIGNTETTNNCFSFSTTAALFRVDETITSKADAKSWVATKYANGRPLYTDYLLEDPINLPCTQAQIDILENIPSTFSGQTNVFSEDEVKAYLRAKGLKDLNTLDSEINNVKQAIVALGGVV